jgi:hypothetical protein
LLLLPAGLTAGVLWLNGASLFQPPGPMVRLSTYLGQNVVELSADAEFPELRLREYPLPAQELCDLIPAALDDLRWRWQRDNGCNYFAVVTTPLLKFQDDVHITVESMGEARSHLHVRSQSRVGKGDLGANRRHVLDLIGRIERQSAVLPRH